MKYFYPLLPLLVVLALIISAASMAHAEGKMMVGKFLICDTAAQITQYLTLRDDEGKKHSEAIKIIGGRACGIGEWVHKEGKKHSEFETDKAKYSVIGVVLHGYVRYGQAIQAKPLKQFAFMVMSSKPKPAGYAI